MTTDLQDMTLTAAEARLTNGRKSVTLLGWRDGRVVYVTTLIGREPSPRLWEGDYA